MITTKSSPTVDIIKILRFQSPKWVRSQSNSTHDNLVKSQLDEYLAYYNTTKQSKPQMYKPKDGNKLLTMSIPIMNDHGSIVGHKTHKSKDPIKPISPKLLTKYIDSAEDKDELFQWVKEWTYVATKKKDVWKLWRPIHLQKLLIRSLTEFGEYSNMLGLIYSLKDKFVRAKNGQVYNIENFFNTVLLCTLLRNHLIPFPDSKIALRKLKTAWSITQLKENKTGLSNILIQSLEQVQKFNTSNELIGFEDKSLVLLNLSNFNSKMVTSNKEKIIQKNELVYLISRTLLDRVNLKQIDIPQESLASMQKFVNGYQQFLSGEEDKYEKMMKSMDELYKSKQIIR